MFYHVFPFKLRMKSDAQWGVSPTIYISVLGPELWWLFKPAQLHTVMLCNVSRAENVIFSIQRALMLLLMCNEFEGSGELELCSLERSLW